MCCLQRNKIPVWTRKEGLGVEWVAPSFVSYASSCLFTSIQCPADPQDNHPTAFSLWPRRQIWEMCFLEQQMSLCWCHHRRVVWVNLLLSCVSLVEFCELENLRLWGGPLFVLDSSTYGHHNDVTERRGWFVLKGMCSILLSFYISYIISY